jgi:hypothetical protein
VLAHVCCSSTASLSPARCNGVVVERHGTRCLWQCSVFGRNIGLKGPHTEKQAV